MQTTQIVTSQGNFTADAAGGAAAPLVLLLHGFPQSRHAYREQLPALAAAGFRAVAPDQRGYSPGVRPPASEFSAYATLRLVADVAEIADAAAAPGAPFHLVGHDWGGQVAWFFAARHPERVRTLSVLSRPHPAAFERAFAENADGQQDRSRHHRGFRDPNTAALLLADDARRLRRTLAAQGVPADAVELYLSVIGTREALDSALAWYRAAGVPASHEVGAIAVPTLFVWGDADATVGPTAARATAEFVAAPYCFEVLPGVGHFVTDQAPARVNELLLAQLLERR